MSSGQDLTDMFRSQGAADVGLDDSATEIVVANLDANMLPMCVGGTSVESLETDDVVLVMLVLDASGSMEEVADDLRREFNQTVIPAWQGAASKTRQAMLVGGIAFNDDVWRLWDGFVTLDEVPKLTPAMYRPGGMTALYEAMEDALSVVSVKAAEVIDETHTPPKAIVFVLSDGANNRPPLFPDRVAHIAVGLSREIFVLAFAGFETYEADHVDFREIARQTGFQAIFETKGPDGESLDDKRRRLRHLLGTFSSSVIRQSQATVSADGSQSFFGPSA